MAGRQDFVADPRNRDALVYLKIGRDDEYAACAR